MMGRQTVDQSQLFYLFNLEARIPAHHLLRRINPTVSRILGNLGYPLVGRLRSLVKKQVFLRNFARRASGAESSPFLAIRLFCPGARTLPSG